MGRVTASRVAAAARAAAACMHMYEQMHRHRHRHDPRHGPRRDPRHYLRHDPSCGQAGMAGTATPTAPALLLLLLRRLLHTFRPIICEKTNPVHREHVSKWTRARAGQVGWVRGAHTVGEHV